MRYKEKVSDDFNSILISVLQHLSLSNLFMFISKVFLIYGMSKASTPPI